MDRTQLINFLIQHRKYQKYLEIGVRNEKDNFEQINCKHKVGVDIKPITSFHGSSDDFFAQNDELFDIIFIDGDHTEKQVLKDINNAFQYLKKGGMILLHDCLPPDEWHQRSVEEFDGEANWNGQVWKAVLRVFNESNYKCSVLDMDWGCGIIDTANQQNPLNLDISDELNYKQHFPYLLKYKINPSIYLSEIDKICVSIVLIPYNNQDKVQLRMERDLFPTINAHPNWNFQLIIVDNSDEDKKLNYNLPDFTNLEYYYLRTGKNMMYGPAMNLAIQVSKHPYLVYVCSNHGQMYDSTWIDDLITPIKENAKTAMTGTLYPSSSPSEMGFSSDLPQHHIQGGLFAAKTDILRKYTYTEDNRWVHWGSDIYQSYQLLNAGFYLKDVSTTKSVWREKVEQPEKFKYVHDYS